MRAAGTPEPSAAGTVRMILADGSRAMVALEDGRTVAVLREQLAPLVPLERVLRVGMRVEGVVDAAAKQLRVVPPSPSAAVLAASFPDGAVTPALVTRVSELGGELALHPEHRVRISRHEVSSNPRDRVDGLLEVGEVVCARVVRLHDGTMRLRLLDVDDDEPVLPALHLLPGGPEWLAPPEAEAPAEPEPEPEPEPALAGPEREGEPQPEARSVLRSALLTIEALRAGTARLERELTAARATSPAQTAELRADLGRALHDKEQLADQLRAARAEVARLRKAGRAGAGPETPRDRRDRFGDAGSWLRHELHLAWIDRVPHQERGEHPLQPGYLIGDGFAASLEVLEDDRLERALRACVDVLTGRAAGMASRAVHPLRTSESGGAPDVVRADGARCMRCAIENSTASARRLHYWRRVDGRLELGRVVLHDETAP